MNKRRGFFFMNSTIQVVLFFSFITFGATQIVSMENKPVSSNTHPINWAINLS